MPFDVVEYHEFIKLMYDHPEWRAEVRQLVLSDEILTLPQLVRDLSVTVHELAEAQTRSENRLTRVEIAVQELAEAQKRTDQKVDRLGVAVGQLNTAFGSIVEEEAASVGGVVFQEKGYRLLGEPFSLPMDGEGEVDVVMPLQDSKGKPLWALVEAKARLSQRDVLRWAQRVNSAAWHAFLAKQGVDGPYLPYCYAIRFDLGARKALEEEGMGLLKSDGEVLPPRALIVPK